MILCYPDNLNYNCNPRIKLICDKINIPITHDLNNKYKVVYHCDYKVLRNTKLNFDVPIINKNCFDVRKITVDKIFTEIFGYSSLINPEIFNEKCVRKTNLQGDKSGFIIQCPTEYKKGFIYQKLINNVLNDLRVEFRVYIINNEIIWIRKKWKKEIFDSKIISSFSANTLFGNQIKQKILQFCKKIGIDYGELDILPDFKEKRLYIIDVNDIPGVRMQEYKQNSYKEEFNCLCKNFKKYYDKCIN